MIIITCSFLIFIKPHIQNALLTVKIFIFHIVKIYFVHNLTWGWIKLSFSMCAYPLHKLSSEPCKLRHCFDNIQRFIYGKDETRHPDDVWYFFWLRCQWSLNISLSFPSFMALECADCCPSFHFNLLQNFIYFCCESKQATTTKWKLCDEEANCSVKFHFHKALNPFNINSLNIQENSPFRKAFPGHLALN